MIKYILFFTYIKRIHVNHSPEHFLSIEQFLSMPFSITIRTIYLYFTSQNCISTTSDQLNASVTQTLSIIDNYITLTITFLTFFHILFLLSEQCLSPFQIANFFSVVDNFLLNFITVSPITAI